MRLYFLLLAALVSFPAHGEEIMATSRITTVTLYPQGAMLSREISFEAAAGAHQLLLTDLPSETYVEAIRLQGGEALSTGAIWLRGDRLFPRPEVLSVEQTAAKEVLKAAQSDLDLAADAVQQVQARVEAADAEVAFLSGSRLEGASLTPQSLREMSAAVAEGVVAARGRAIAAGAEMRPLSEALEAATRARDQAQAGYESLPTRDENYTALSIAVQVAAPGPHLLLMTQYIESASWSPVYDLTLRRSADPSLILARGAIVSQYTGEDWKGVALTLSTARPSYQTEPSMLYPDYREIYDPEAEMAMMSKSEAEPAMADGMVMEVVASAAPMAEMQGDVLVYRVQEPASIASGVDSLRLSLDEITFAAKVQARAIPRNELVAYMTAEFINTSDEVLLPGPVMLYRDSNLIGLGELPLLAAGAEWTQGFGAIEGLVLERQMPEVSEGDRGLLSSETEQTQSAVLIVKNLTDEAWAVRLMDQVPYSEQEDLEVTFGATPEPSEVDVDGQRGILAWEFDLAAGAEQSVQIEHALRWPSGMALR